MGKAYARFLNNLYLRLPYPLAVSVRHRTSVRVERTGLTRGVVYYRQPSVYRDKMGNQLARPFLLISIMQYPDNLT